jgi:hypothetical protein
MKKEKLNLKSIKKVMSREEMKNIMAGSGNCNPRGGACGPYTQSVCCSGLQCIVTGTAPGYCW